MSHPSVLPTPVPYKMSSALHTPGCYTPCKTQRPDKWGGFRFQGVRRGWTDVWAQEQLAAQDRQDPGLINNFRTAVTARCAGEKSWSMLYYALALDIGCCRMLIAACIRPWCFLPQHETLSKKPRENWVRDFSCQWFLFPTSSPSPAAGSAVITVALQQTSCLKPWRLTNKSWSWWPPSSTMSTMLQTRQWKEMPCLALLLPVGLRQAIGRLNPGSKTKQLLYLLCL